METLKSSKCLVDENSFVHNFGLIRRFDDARFLIGLVKFGQIWSTAKSIKKKRGKSGGFCEVGLRRLGGLSES